MIKKNILTFCLLISTVFCIKSQINTDRVMIIGRNALYYEDYVLSIQYFNQVIKAKPYLAEPYYYRAIAKFYLDDSKGAEEDCSMVIERNPFLIDAYQLRADTRLNQEKYEDAIQDYRKALSNYPDNKYALINVAVANVQQKNYEEAENDIKRLIQIYPQYTQAYLVEGALNIEKGDTIKALKSYDKAIETDKYYSQAYSLRGLVNYNLKDYDKALSDFDEAIKLDPMVIGNYINRGLVKYSKNDLRGAMADYDQVIDKEPGNIIARFNRGLLRGQVGDDNRAISDFNYVIQSEPENYIAYMNRSLLKQNIADYRGALADLNVVLAAHPDFYQGYYMRSELKRKMNDLKSAEQDYLYAQNQEKKIQREALSNPTKENDNKAKDDKTREKSDKTIDRFNLLVVADAEEQQKSKYKNESRGRVQDKQIKIEPEAAFVLTYYPKEKELKSLVYDNTEVDAFNKQNILNQRLFITNSENPLNESQIQAHFASIDEYSKQIASRPLSADLYFARAMDYIMVKNFPSAIEDLEKTIELNPKFTLAYFNLAVIYSKQLMFNENIPNSDYNLTANDDKRLGTGTKTTSDPLLVGTLKAPNLIKDKETEERLVEYHKIIQNYAKVIELDPKFIYAYYNKAEIGMMLRDYRAAVLDYNEAIKREPEFAEAYFNRGLNRLQLGEKEKGLDDLRKSGELGIVNAYNIIKRMNE